MHTTDAAVDRNRRAGMRASATSRSSGVHTGDADVCQGLRILRHRLKIVLLAARLERGKCEGAVDFLALGPVVIGVALEATGFGVVGAGRVAGFAVVDTWNEDVGGVGAGERPLMAVGATEAAVRVVIELGVREPFRGNSHGGDPG